MNPLYITFVMKGITSATLYYGKPVRYKGIKVGTITNWGIREDKRIYLTARIDLKSIAEKIANGIIITELEVNKR